MRQRRFLRILIPGAILALFLIGTVSAGAPALPESPRRMVYDTLHGTVVADPYRWLEDGNSPEVKRWVDLQDKYTRHLLKNYPRRKMLEKRLDQLLQIGSVGSPKVKGDRYFFTRREAGQDHEVLYVRRGDGPPEVAIDPNRFSKEGTVALDWWLPSNDGRLLAYGKSSDGTENSTLFIYDLETRQHLPDTIPSTSAADIAWLNDRSGFYYTRFPLPGTVPPEDKDFYRHVYFHKIGDDYRRDIRIFGEGRDKTEWPGVQLSPDERYLLVSAFLGWSECSLFLRDLKGDTGFVLITAGMPSYYDAIPGRDRIYIRTNFQAPFYKIMTADYKKPQIQYWRECVPESELAIQEIHLVGDKIVVGGLRNASSRLVFYSLEGKERFDVSLPEIGSIAGIDGDREGKEILFGYGSYFIPPIIYRCDLATGKMTPFETVKSDLDFSRLEVNQVWYESKDGTRVSMFVVHKKDLVKDGSSPAILYGYGGFNVNEVPTFSRNMMLWYERGGIYAEPQIRGGGEYGEEWHEGGMLDKKQNGFDDFIAAAEWLIANKYTSREKLVISGGSNGGLLTGAMLVQRPDLMRVVISSRPLLDMLRYHKFLIGALWIPEYGSADNPSQFPYLLAYSPYHNIKEGTAFPAVYLESGDSDSRTDPLHARKMAAALQVASSANNPILLRVERQTGHGQGEPMRKIVAELLDQWCFIFWQLGL